MRTLLFTLFLMFILIGCTVNDVENITDSTNDDLAVHSRPTSGYGADGLIKFQRQNSRIPNILEPRFPFFILRVLPPQGLLFSIHTPMGAKIRNTTEDYLSSLQKKGM